MRCKCKVKQQVVNGMESTEKGNRTTFFALFPFSPNTMCEVFCWNILICIYNNLHVNVDLLWSIVLNCGTERSINRDMSIRINLGYSENNASLHIVSSSRLYEKQISCRWTVCYFAVVTQHQWRTKKKMHRSAVYSHITERSCTAGSNGMGVVHIVEAMQP